MQQKPTHIIINPLSGYGGQNALLSDLRKSLHASGRDVVEHVTTGPGDATGIAGRIADEASVVISFGGDGTVNEIAQGLLGSDTPMLCVRAGTENLLAKELRIPRGASGLMRVLNDDNAMDFDVGVINDRTFHSIIGVGFDAEVVRRVASERTGHISHLSYFWPIWRTFWEHDFPEIRVDADGEEVFCGEGLVFVGNISRYSSGLRICRDAVCNDGLLDLVIFKCSRQGRLVFHAATTIVRRHIEDQDVISRKVENVRIQTEKPLTCQVDGDVGPVSPLDISIAPQKIKLLVPRIPRRGIASLFRKNKVKG